MRSIRPRPRAGRHADDWFQRTYKPWRRRARLAFVLVSPIWLAFILAFVFIWPNLREFFLGVAAGSTLALYIAIIDSPPEWIERKRRGRDGERRTERRLAKLESAGWAVAHDITARWGNFDHLVVGPGGAYLLETKDFIGRLDVADGVLTVRRGDDERDAWRPVRPIERTVKGNAKEARDQLLAFTGIRYFQGVVVVWSDFEQQAAQLDDVWFVHGDHLCDWLLGRPEKLSSDVVAKARRALEVFEHQERDTSVAVAA